MAGMNRDDFVRDFCEAYAEDHCGADGHLWSSIDSTDHADCIAAGVRECELLYFDEPISEIYNMIVKYGFTIAKVSDG